MSVVFDCLTNARDSGASDPLDRKAGLIRRAFDLAAADAAWLVSSVRLAAPIRSVDGIPKPVDAELTSAFTAHLRASAG